RSVVATGRQDHGAALVTLRGAVMAQAQGIGLEGSGDGHPTVLTGHDAAAATLRVPGSGYPVDVQLAGEGAGAASVFGDQVIQAGDHFLAGAGVGGSCGGDHETVAGPVFQQPAVGARRATGAVAPENDRMLEAILTQGAGPIDRAGGVDVAV